MTDPEATDPGATDPDAAEPGVDGVGVDGVGVDEVGVEVGPIQAFVRSRLPAPPGPILEIGAGTAELAADLSRSGFEVTSIDTRHRERRERRQTLETFEPDERFAVALAIGSLHHVDDVGPAVARLPRLVRPGGWVIVQGFAWDRIDLSTTTWLHGERTRLGRDVPRDPIAFYEGWRHDHKDLVPSVQVIAALDNVLERTYFAWTPYLADAYLDGDEEARRRERAALERGRIRAAGFRYVGRVPAGADPAGGD